MTPPALHAAVLLLARLELNRNGVGPLSLTQCEALREEMRAAVVALEAEAVAREIEPEWRRVISEVAMPLSVQRELRERFEQLSPAKPAAGTVPPSDAGYRLLLAALSIGLPEADGRQVAEFVAAREYVLACDHIFDVVGEAELTVPDNAMDDLLDLRGEMQMAPVTQAPALAGASLSPQETNVLEALLDGLPNKAIAKRLDVTEATVKVHMKHIYRKTGTKNRTQAALWAAKREAA